MLDLTLLTYPVLTRAVDLNEVVAFSIARQPLESALIAFSNQAHIQILISPQANGTTLVPALKGTLPVRVALDRLLKDTGLTYVEHGQSITVTPVSVKQSASATAGEENETPSQTTGSASGSSALQEVVVTAQKRAESLQNVPISISVVSGNQLDAPTFTSARDALATIPGVAINQQYTGNGTQVTIRGVAAGQGLFAGSAPVAYYLDAMPFGLVKSAVAPDQDVFDLQRIEVLRGPQGTLYGASALNGVVRILTNDADPDHLEVKVRGSDSYTDDGGNNYRGDMAVNVPLVDGRLAVRAVLGYENDSGWIDTPDKKDFNNVMLRNYRLKINALPTDDFSVGVSYWGSRDYYGGPNTADDDYINTSVNNQATQTGFDAYDMKLGYNFSGYSLSSSTSYLKWSFNARIDFTSLAAGFPEAVSTNLNSDVFAEELLLNSPSTGPWRWSLGSMYRRATEDRFQYLTVLGAAEPGPVNGFIDTSDDISRSWAVYGEVTRLLLDDKLELTAGLRQFEDRVTQTGETALTGPMENLEGTFHATTPRAVMTYHLAPTLLVYASYSEGFRSGFPQEISVPPQVINAIPLVHADKLHNYELGTKESFWNGRGSFDASVYYMKWNGVQQTLEVPFALAGGGYGFTNATVNGTSASGPGTDLSIMVEPLDGLTFGVNASWNKLEMDSTVYSGGSALFNKGDRLNTSPETTAGGSAAYQFPLASTELRGRVFASVNYTSAQTFRTGPPTLLGAGDAMVIGRIGVSVELRDMWTGTLFVNNVNNDRGAVIRPFENGDLSSRVQPRTAGLQFEYHFK